MSDSRLYPGLFWIMRRDTHQYVIVKGGGFGYAVPPLDRADIWRNPA